MDERVDAAFRQVLQRPARGEEKDVLIRLYEQHLKQYRADTKSATAYLAVGARPAPNDVDPAEFAAWTNVARVVLNLHEAISRN
jgi:hypothetical protein